MQDGMTKQEKEKLQNVDALVLLEKLETPLKMMRWSEPSETIEYDTEADFRSEKVSKSVTVKDTNIGQLVNELVRLSRDGNELSITIGVKEPKE